MQNCNHYAAPENVWLGLGNHGLQDGLYYFAVTLPSEKATASLDGDSDNLSYYDIDGANSYSFWSHRQFMVKDRRIQAVKFPTGYTFDNTIAGAERVRVAPFRNPGGVYRLQVCKIGGPEANFYGIGTGFPADGACRCVKSV